MKNIREAVPVYRILVAAAALARVPHHVVNRLREADTARLGFSEYPSSDIYAVTHHVVADKEHVAQVDADAMLEGIVVRSVALRGAQATALPADVKYISRPSPVFLTTPPVLSTQRSNGPEVAAHHISAMTRRTPP